MKLIKAINSALTGDWSQLTELIGKDSTHTIIDTISSMPQSPPEFEKLWMMVKPIMFLKDLRRPEQMDVGDDIVVLFNGQLVRGEITRLDPDPEWRFSHYAWRPLDSSVDGGRMQALRTNRDQWGIYPFPLPDFRVQMEFYLKIQDTTMDISCCDQHMECQKKGMCISTAYDDRGVVFNCSLSRKYKSLQRETPVIVAPEANLIIQEHGQLALF